MDNSPAFRPTHFRASRRAHPCPPTAGFGKIVRRKARRGDHSLGTAGCLRLLSDGRSSGAPPSLILLQSRPYDGLPRGRPPPPRSPPPLTRHTIRRGGHLTAASRPTPARGTAARAGPRRSWTHKGRPRAHPGEVRHWLPTARQAYIPRVDTRLGLPEPAVRRHRISPTSPTVWPHDRGMCPTVTFLDGLRRTAQGGRKVVVMNELRSSLTYHVPGGRPRHGSGNVRWALREPAGTGGLRTSNPMGGRL